MYNNISKKCTEMINVLTKMKKVVKKVLPKQILNIIKIFYKKDNNIEIHKLGIRNPKKIFYVIKIFDPHWGSLSSWLCSMPRVKFALDSGYVPIIDFKNISDFPSMLLDLDKFKKENAWDLYFTQPQIDYSLDDILKSSKVIYSSVKHNIDYSNFSRSVINGNLPLSNIDFLVLKKLYSLCHLNDEIIRTAMNTKNKLFPAEKKVLGVSFRRCFERLHEINSDLTPIGTHIIRLTLKQLLIRIRELLKLYNYDLFFFTTDDRESLTVVKEEFGDKCIYNERPLGHHFENGNPIPKGQEEKMIVEFYKREKDVYLRNIEYLTDVYILSQCDSLLSCGGTADLFAYIINDGKYEHVVQPGNEQK